MKLLAQRGNRRSLVGFLTAMLSLAALASCDSTATLYVSEVQWDDLYFVSAAPARKVVGESGTSYDAFCRSAAESPDGLMFNVLFQGTEKKDIDDGDLAILPGDRIALKEVLESKVTPELFEMSITCLKSLVAGDSSSCLKADNLKFNTVDFYNYGVGPEADRDVAVAILIDMSGSMKGLVHPFPPYFEDQMNKVFESLPEGFDFSKNATDPAGARITAVSNLIDTLNEGKDSLIVFTFNEDAINVVCDLASDPDADTEKKKAECFGTFYSPVKGGAGGFGALDDIKGDERGRSPLWSAVEDVYQYMQSSDVAQKATFRHILVLTDGPDTCAPSTDLNSCRDICIKYNTGFETLQSMITSAPLEDRIPVHFVQLAAPGYPERDPRQAELACLTGGQYTFVNTTTIPVTSRLTAIETALKRVRYTFRGYWRFGIDLAVVKKANEPPAGKMYGIEATGKVLPGAGKLLVNTERVYSVGYDQTTFLDHRVAFRKECDPDGKLCDKKEKYNECSWTVGYCDPQSMVGKTTRTWDENGKACPEKIDNAKIVVKVETKGASGTQVEYKEKKLKPLPAVCCGGDCMPPAPPEVPDSVAKPDGMVQYCFEYEKGWLREDANNPNSAWVYYAVLRQGSSSSCTWASVEPAIEYASISELTFPQDWECTANKNCFPPPGANVEPPVEEETE